MNETKLSPGDLIQVNEDGPPNWFRCIIVVDEVKGWGVQGYCVMPRAHGELSVDVWMRLEWREFDAIGAKSKFVAIAIGEAQ